MGDATPSLFDAHERLTERVYRVKRTDAYSRPRWTLADVSAVERLLRQVRGCPVCAQELGWSEKEAPEADPECETCGHPRSAHNLTIETCRCEKSIYTDAPLGGGNVYPCQCSGFKGPV